MRFMFLRTSSSVSAKDISQKSFGSLDRVRSRHLLDGYVA